MMEEEKSVCVCVCFVCFFPFNLHEQCRGCVDTGAGIVITVIVSQQLTHIS